jgi:hypothetical protein
VQPNHQLVCSFTPAAAAMQAQGMQGWRRFTFFDRDDAAAAAHPETLAAHDLEDASCAAAAASWLAFGKPDGSVVLLDTTSQAVAAFRAHPAAVQHMVVLPVRSSAETEAIMRCYGESTGPTRRQQSRQHWR